MAGISYCFSLGGLAGGVPQNKAGVWGGRQPTQGGGGFPGLGSRRYFWPSVFFGGLGYQGQQTTHVQEERCFWALPPSGQNTTLSLKMCGFLALVSQASKNHLAKKLLRDPFEVRGVTFPRSPNLSPQGGGEARLRGTGLRGTR